MNVSSPIKLAVLLTLLTGSLSLAQEQNQPMKMPMPGEAQSMGSSSMAGSPGMMGMCQPKGPQMANSSPTQKMGCCSMMGQEKMGGMSSGSGGGIFGSQVTPVMNLSVDQVRDYLAVQLDHLNNKRLKVGDVKADDKTITADIVTLDNSLVQRLGVDRRTGGIEYRN